MTRSGVLLAITCGLIFVSGCSKTEFKEYTSAVGKYKVQLPGSPKEESRNAAGTTLNAAAVQQKDGVYAVVWSDLPIQAGESTNGRLDRSRDETLANIKAPLKAESMIMLDGKYEGRDFQADLPGGKGLLHARIYLVGTRLYQVMVVGKPTWVSSADSLKFLESFEVTK